MMKRRKRSLFKDKDKEKDQNGKATGKSGMWGAGSHMGSGYGWEWFM
jgi:hypothetical protein